MNAMTQTQDANVEADVVVEDGLPPVVARVTFANGLVGCKHWQHFDLRGDFSREPVGLLISRDDPDRIFFVSPVEYTAPGGMLRFNNEDTRALRQHGAGVRDEVLTLVTLNVDDAGSLTANLLGPLVIDLETCEGRQVVLTDVTLSTRHRVMVAQSDGAE